MLACGLMVLLAVVLAYRWRSYQLALPDWASPEPDGVRAPVLELLWLLAVGILAGLSVGALVVGAGGRLVMRLLAATSPESQGFQTEAEETVGRITLGGTIGFIIFIGLGFGLAVGVTYVFVAFVLPRGIAGGVLFGVALLVVFATHLDPLRAGNPDFTIVGPAWLAVSSFTVLAVLTGAVTTPIAGRVAAGLGHPRPRWAWWLVPTGLVTLAGFADEPAAAVVPVVGGAIFILARTNPQLRERLRRPGRAVAGLALIAVVLASLPSFISAVDDILTVA